MLLCITANFDVEWQRWVIFVGGDRGWGPVYVRSTSDRVEILCTAVKDAKCQEPTYAVQQICSLLAHLVRAEGAPAIRGTEFMERRVVMLKPIRA